MSATHGTLACAEAERRLAWLVNSLYMAQVPRSPSVLHMPSLTIVTPHYNEPVLYSREGFLAPVNAAGVSPMTYLKAVHPLEWRNLCERLGVGSEAGAWGAVRDAEGASCSGELEVRSWASHRGQTLCRTVDGMMASASAVRLLAGLQLEQEYELLLEAEEEREGGEGGRERESAAATREAAALGAQWFVRQRISYVLAAQRHGEHGEEDVARRAECESLMLRHPLLSVAHWEACSGAWGGCLQTVLRGGDGGVLWRLPCPGNPVADGVGEGKPHNQLNAVTFATGRCLQTIDSECSGAAGREGASVWVCVCGGACLLVCVCVCVCVCASFVSGLSRYYACFLPPACSLTHLAPSPPLPPPPSLPQ